MNFKDITDRLSPEQKNRLKNARTKEELDGIFTGSGMKLTDDQLDMVAGGKHYGGAAKGGGGCFVPDVIDPGDLTECPVCGTPHSDLFPCPTCNPKGFI